MAHAIVAIRDAIAAVSKLPKERIGNDDDLADDLSLDELEFESLGLIISEVFAVDVPDELWHSPLYRTPASLADWCIRHSEAAAWAETQAMRRFG